MPNFKIPVSWIATGSFNVEADTLENAITLVEDAIPPYDSFPKNAKPADDDNLKVNKELAKRLNQESDIEIFNNKLIYNKINLEQTIMKKHKTNLIAKFLKYIRK